MKKCSHLIQILILAAGFFSVVKGFGQNRPRGQAAVGREPSVYGPYPAPIVPFEELPNWKKDITIARKQKTDFFKKYYSEYARQYAQSRRIMEELTPFEIIKLRAVRKFGLQEDIEDMGPPKLEQTLERLQTASLAFENVGLVSIMQNITQKFGTIDKRMEDIEGRLVKAGQASAGPTEDKGMQRLQNFESELSSANAAVRDLQLKIKILMGVTVLLAFGLIYSLFSTNRGRE